MGSVRLKKKKKERIYSKERKSIKNHKRGDRTAKN
jgi:hypothetical protein